MYHLPVHWESNSYPSSSITLKIHIQIGRIWWIRWQSNIIFTSSPIASIRSTKHQIMRPNSLKVNFCDENNYYQLKIHTILKNLMTRLSLKYSHYLGTMTIIYTCTCSSCSDIFIIVHGKLIHHRGHWGKITSDLKCFFPIIIITYSSLYWTPVPIIHINNRIILLGSRSRCHTTIKSMIT